MVAAGGGKGGGAGMGAGVEKHIYTWIGRLERALMVRRYRT